MEEELSARDLDVLRLTASGLTNREIAARMGLAPKTVEHMLGTADPYRAIYAKIGVTNRAEAAAWYVAHFGDPTQTSLGASAAEQLLAVLTDYQARIYAVRLAGQPELAISMADFVFTQADQAAQHTYLPHYADAMQRICLAALVQKGTALLELSVAGTSVHRVRPVVTQIAAMAARLKHAEYAGLAHAMLAGAYNIDKRYGRGLALVCDALGQAATGPSLSADLRLRIVRTGVVAALYLDKPAVVSDLARTAHQLIEAGRFTQREQVCETQEAIARAHGIMDLGGAPEWFDAAEDSLAAIGLLPLRHLRLLQSKLEVLCARQPAALCEIERLGRDAIWLAERYGYPRHRGLIVDALITALDT